MNHRPRKQVHSKSDFRIPEEPDPRMVAQFAIGQLSSALDDLAEKRDFYNAGHVATATITDTIAFIRKHGDKLKASIQPCGEVDCTCHETRLLCIEALSSLFDRLPGDIQGQITEFTNRTSK